MNTELPDPPVRSRWRWRPGRGLAILLAFLVLLEAVYVVGGLALLRSGQVGRWINTHPEKLQITFDSVLPIVPGMVRVRGFRLLIQDRVNQIDGRVEEVWAAVNPLEIPAGRFHLVWVRARGVTFRMRPRPESAAAAAAGLPSAYAPIEGVPWVPYSGPPPEGRKEKATLAFTRSSLDDVRDVWIGERRLRGAGSVLASVTIHGDGRVAIPLADVRFHSAKLENGADVTFSELKLRVRGELPAFDPDDPKGVPVATDLRARVDFEARMPSGSAYLNALLKNAPWITFGGGEGSLALHLAVKDGKLAPGGFFELKTDDLRASFSGFTAKGMARTRLDVAASEASAAGGDPEAKLVVEFDRYGLRRGPEGSAPLIEGSGLKIALTTPASVAEIPPREFSGRLDLGKAELPRLVFLNEVLPAGGTLRILGGSGKIEGAFDVANAGASGRGAVQVKAHGLALDAGGVAVKGDFSLDVKVPRCDLVKQAFDLDATLLALERFTFKTKHEEATPADWNARIAFPKAHLQLGDAFAVRGGLDLRASDSRPVAAFLSADEPLAGWKKKLVTVGEIKGGGRFSLAGGALAVDDGAVGWSNVKVQARFRTAEKGTTGKALVSAGILQAGIGLEGGKRKLKILRPESWYKEP